MTFTMSDGTKIKTPEFLAKMGSYGDSMDTMINALGNDGVLSVEEAQAIIEGDSNYYNQLRKEKENNLRIRIPQLNSNLNTINKEIAKLEKPNADVAKVIGLLLQDPDIANDATLVSKLQLYATSPISNLEDLATDEGVINNSQGVLTALKETKDLLNAEYQKQLVIADAWGFEDAYGKPAEFIKDRMPRKNGGGTPQGTPQGTPEEGAPEEGTPEENVPKAGIPTQLNKQIKFQILSNEDKKLMSTRLKNVAKYRSVKFNSKDTVQDKFNKLSPKEQSIILGEKILNYRERNLLPEFKKIEDMIDDTPI